MTLRRGGQRLRCRDRIGVATVRLEGGERDVVHQRVRLAPVQLRRGHNFSIDADASQHRDVRPQPRRVALVNHHREPGLDKAASPADDVAPVAEVVMTLPRQLGFRRERVMHPDQRARACRHSGANSAFVEHAHAGAGAREMERDRASDHARANHYYVRAR